MLTLKKLSKCFTCLKNPVLRQINLELKPGDFCILLGGNGSGKSTLLHTIAGEYPLDEGQIYINNQPSTQSQRLESIALVKQDVSQGTIPELTLLENLILSLSKDPHHKLSLYHQQAQKLSQNLRQLNLKLETYLHTPLKHLSGGQRQLIATLMAFNTQPQVLLLDEHTSALDPSMQNQVMDFTAKTIQHRQLTSLMVTHQLSQALHYGNRLIMLEKGSIILDVAGAEKTALEEKDLIPLFHSRQEGINHEC